MSYKSQSMNKPSSNGYNKLGEYEAIMQLMKNNRRWINNVNYISIMLLCAITIFLNTAMGCYSSDIQGTITVPEPQKNY